ncbi:tyrosine-protein phosphatase [Steroidobacter denitrificans]|nr:tyrosine-protein phosphatase [Steroidobacter denitrificans]
MSETGSGAPRCRVLPFQGACNFRDIGGYVAQDGRTVRWGRVYRTGVLSYLGEDDRDALRSLRIRAICDLRRGGERRREPTRWPEEGDLPRKLHWQDGAEAPAIRDFAVGRPPTAAGMFDAMIDMYRALPAWMGSRIGGLFECIANDHVPLIVHCAAGKDRTGIAVAVLLHTLGIPWETIIEDYLLTNLAGNFETFMRTRRDIQLGLTDSEHPLLAMPVAMRRVLFSAEAAFLQAAKDEIDLRYGGLDAYLERAAGITPTLRERMRQTLLEPL